MFRFTIRDVLWLTMVVALLACWSLERVAAVRQGQRSREREANLQIVAEDLRGQLNIAENQNAVMRKLVERQRVADFGVTE